MKRIIGNVLDGRAQAQAFLMKMAVYPRFYRWTRDHPIPKALQGEKRQVRNVLFSEVLTDEKLADDCVVYFEFGVYRGESIRWWSEHSRHKQSIFVGFDSFEGLPEDWLETRKKGAFSTGKKIPKIDDDRVSFAAGWFHKTLHDQLHLLDTTSRVILHLDADLYRSTIFPLMVAGPYLKGGDILIFDEFLDSTHEFRAFEDAVAIFNWSYEIIAASPGYAQVAVRLARDVVQSVGRQAG